MAKNTVTVVAIKDFSTVGRRQTIHAKVGDKLEISKSTARRLIRTGFVRKYRPHRSKKKEEEK